MTIKRVFFIQDHYFNAKHLIMWKSTLVKY